MPGRIKNPWLDPNKEGKGRGRRAKRYCVRCGNTVRQSRILKAYNLCEYCVQEMKKKKEKNWVCLGCGRLAPEEVKVGGGYCRKCLCPACGKPDPAYVKIAGLCRECAKTAGVFCIRCGKEAPAQVRKNKGFCDLCSKKK
ncbi:MAG TPA: hypothetical protein DDW93_06465 [Firmicutes bacterium]|jgi:hypothetical protein|nr:hypothetical protein [Bacillota bacterium]HBK68268.1 hypothetical protein [Bacillota bacterium]